MMPTETYEVEFYIASTGRVICTYTDTKPVTDDKIEEIRQNLAFEKGFELNDIAVEHVSKPG